MVSEKILKPDNVKCALFLQIAREKATEVYNAQTFTETLVTPKIGYVDAMPLSRSRHLALNSPLGHFNGDNTRLSIRRTKFTVKIDVAEESSWTPPSQNSKEEQSPLTDSKLEPGPIFPTENQRD